MVAKQAAQDRTISEYHELVDKELQGIATPKDLASLEQIKTKMHAIADEQTAAFDDIAEQRHNALMEKLSSLTNELRRFPAAPSAAR